MNKSLPNNHFDNYFRDRYKKHTIVPEKELWENINAHMNKKKLIISLRKIRRLKIAVTVFAFALIGTLTLIVTDLIKQENVTTDVQEQTMPDFPAERKSKNPLKLLVRKADLSYQEQEQEQEEQDIPEIDSSKVILSKKTDSNIDNIISPVVVTK